MIQLQDNITSISGVGEKMAKTLQKVGISTVRDMLYYLPRAYKDYSRIQKFSDVKIGEAALFEVKIFTAPKTRRVRKGLEITSFQVSDESAIVNVDIFNQVYIKTYMKQNETIYIYGKLAYQMKKLSISGPEIFFKKPEDPFFPIYPLTAGLTQPKLRKLMKEALRSTEIKEMYSQQFCERFGLEGLHSALHDVHFPIDIGQAKQARARIVFDELLVFCRMIELLNEEQTGDSAVIVHTANHAVDDFTALLGFVPTNAQRKIMGEIRGDIGSPRYMNRLVQGDVGSGKTAVAFFAMHCMRQAGYQSVMMAPTEILAEQHAQSARELFDDGEIVLVTGSMKAKQRREAMQKIQDGSVKIIIGTHALIYGGLEFASLGLLITDEQHRFGVRQRAALAGAAHDIHTLIMSATPIPRSLALVLYGKTDISILDEMPAGRKPVKTYLIRRHKYDTMIGFITDEVQTGSQAYIVCPLIEDGDDDELKSAQAMFDELQQQYAGIPMALLHGRMKAADKQAAMRAFHQGDVRILVSTTVIEVGVNVPNATVMVVLNAERFGLAQLHQLRGRVGRGGAQSYCFLVSDNQNAFERLRVLVQTNDGFEIAEQDMRFRGTGDVFGTRQHGQGALHIANLIADSRQLEKARDVLDVLRGTDDFRQEYKAVTGAAKAVMTQKMVEIALN